ncbi:MAG: sulfite exporter TauE/SafE family protein [Bradymonadales bacterium]|nr:sulfite exporter TauE/SafE family protein [Bradymonadales bacterium]
MDFDLFNLVGLVVLGLLAGWLGAVIGIGGGIVIVPTLVLLFGLDIRVAVASSLVAVVATSTAAGSAYVGEGLANMRLGMSLEIATTLGGVTGGVTAVLLPESVIGVVFAAMMVVTATLMARKREESERAPLRPVRTGEVAAASPKEGWEQRGGLGGAYYDAHLGTLVTYRAQRLHVGSAVSFFAGILSGLLGVGGGFMKVPAMNLGMGVPIKVAAATSNFMIGVTAVSSLFVYFARGFIHPLVAVPVVLGVTGGAVTGAFMSQRFAPGIVRWILVVTLLALAVQMGLDAFGVSLGR